MKKAIWIMAAVFVFSLFAPVGSASAAAYPADLIPLAVKPAESVQLQWYLVGEKPAGFDEVTEKLNQRLASEIGATINFNFIGYAELAANDWEDLMLASGETIDLMQTASWMDYAADAQNGDFYPLSGLLDEYAPKTKAALGSTVQKGAEVGGEVYALPAPGQMVPKASGSVVPKRPGLKIQDRFEQDQEAG